MAGTYGENPRLSDDRKHAALLASPPPQKYPRVASVYAEWTDAIRSGTQPGSNFPGHAAPLTEMILLGNLALRTGRTIELDPESGRVTNGAIPEELIAPAYRTGWTL